jgi:Mg-chelatase subunit ChlD
MSTDSSQYPLTGQSGTGSLTKAQQQLYEYYMVQIPSNFMANANQVQGNEIAAYVQEWANKLSASGWEFYRIDTMSMTVNPGCLDSLFGARQSYIQYSVMTFRRLR